MAKRKPVTDPKKRDRLAREASGRLLSAMAEHDPLTASHSIRVGDYCLALALVMGLESDLTADLARAALLHDVGKLEITIEILQKPELLDPEQMDTMKLHPVLGASILTATPGLDHLVAPVLHHHERWDGRGYPTGLAGLDIPLESRLILVADAYDAMTSDKPYGAAVSPDVALDELLRYSAKQFDPLIVAAMQSAARDGLLDEVAAQHKAPTPNPS